MTPPQNFASGRRGLMLILSSPSGAGKSTLTRMLMQDAALSMTLSVSVTTRERRSSEVDGVHYHFISRHDFERRRAEGDFLEWAEVHGHYYGSPRSTIEPMLAQGRDVLFDIDYQGTQQMRQKAPDDIVTIFILPPTMRELKARLERRAEDNSETIAKRLANARHEIQRWAMYDYVLVNDDLQNTYRHVITILQAERLRRPRAQQAIGDFIKTLLAEPSASA
jgi:guanylate kinase